MMISKDRRLFLFGLSTILTAPVSAFAITDNVGSGRDISDVIGIPGTRNAKGQIQLRQLELTTLTHKQINWLILFAKNREVDVVGFTLGVTSWVLHGLFHKRRRMSRLIRKLLDVKDTQERRRIIREEISAASADRRTVQANVFRLEAKIERGEKLTLTEHQILADDRREADRLEQYIEAVRFWLKTPEVGAPTT